MKYLALLFGCFFLFTTHTFAQNKDNPWNANQLMKPLTLASQIKAKKTDNTLILSIGFDNPIKNSIQLGPAEKQEGLDKLTAYLKDIPKDQKIVIYCGCCPMEKCPNIRPAFSLLQKLGYKNVKLLALKTSVKADWMDKGFPVQKTKK